MKQYKLLKDLPGIKAGHIFNTDEAPQLMIILPENSLHKDNIWMTMANLPEWFEEVLPIKTIREWLQELPDGYRELAMQCGEEYGHWDEETDSFYDAIKSAFPRRTTKEGWDFRNAVAHHKNGSPLPPLPQKGRWKPKKCERYWNFDFYSTDKDVDWVTCSEDTIDEGAYCAGSCFQTKEQAEAYKYLVEHEQMMCDNWDKDNIYYQYNVGAEGWFRDEYRGELPSKWIVPYGRTHKQMTEHKKKLMLVYPRLFNK